MITALPNHWLSNMKHYNTLIKPCFSQSELFRCFSKRSKFISINNKKRNERKKNKIWFMHLIGVYSSLFITLLVHCPPPILKRQLTVPLHVTWNQALLDNFRRTLLAYGYSMRVLTYGEQYTHTRRQCFIVPCR